MKHNTMLTVASLLSLLFLTLHITDDIVRGISKAESSNTALLVLAVFLYGTLMLAERRLGHVIILLIGLIAYLRRLVDAGFSDRIMFGSDNMVWPDSFGLAIRRTFAPFLSDDQKRDILCRNAARFLRLPDDVCRPQF
jgi:amidohydrolase family protein